MEAYVGQVPIEPLTYGLYQPLRSLLQPFGGEGGRRLYGENIILYGCSLGTFEKGLENRASYLLF